MGRFFVLSPTSEVTREKENYRAWQQPKQKK
jgi:hypothetical protein